MKPDFCKVRAGKFSRALRARGEVSAMDLKKEFLVRGVKIEKSQLSFFLVAAIVRFCFRKIELSLL